MQKTDHRAVAPGAHARERRVLQIAISIAACVPVLAGIAGLLGGPAFFGGSEGSAAFDSHFRYLSGLLLGIGLTFWSFVPRITSVTLPVRVLTGLVVLGGIGRLLSLALHGWPSSGMMFGLFMELVTTPLLCLWQGRIARQASCMNS
jgi:hypothetical protein